MIAVTGAVLSGRGQARKHIEAQHAAFREALGEDLIPGSLNLVLSRPVFFNLDRAISLANGNRLLWKARLSNQDVWAYRWPDAPLHVVEVLSSIHFRKTFGIKDGDRMPIHFSDCDVLQLSVRQKIAWWLVWAGRKSWAYTWDLYPFGTRQLAIDLGATQRPVSMGAMQAIWRFMGRVFRKIER